MRKEPGRQLRLLHIAGRLRQEPRLCSLPVLAGESAIVPVVVENEIYLCRLCKAPLEKGIYINPILRPAAAQTCSASPAPPRARPSARWVRPAAWRSGWRSSSKRAAVLFRCRTSWATDRGHFQGCWGANQENVWIGTSRRPN